MAKNLIQSGDVLTLTAPGTLSSGAGVLVGFIFGIVQIDVTSGQDMPVAVRGVWSINKLSTDAFAEGAKVYWDDTNKRVTATSSSNTYIGRACTQGGVISGSTVVNVLLNEYV
jgi:predicted RecA/RadA family phage recombinase